VPPQKGTLYSYSYSLLRSEDRNNVAKNTESARFKIPTRVTMKGTIFWDVASRSPVKVNRRFGVMCASIFRADVRISEARNTRPCQIFELG
jgi:hypothetical protein